MSRARAWTFAGLSFLYFSVSAGDFRLALPIGAIFGLLCWLETRRQPAPNGGLSHNEVLGIRALAAVGLAEAPLPSLLFMR